MIIGKRFRLKAPESGKSAIPDNAGGDRLGLVMDGLPLYKEGHEKFSQPFLLLADEFAFLGVIAKVQPGSAPFKIVPFWRICFVLPNTV